MKCNAVKGKVKSSTAYLFKTKAVSRCTSDGALHSRTGDREKGEAVVVSRGSPRPGVTGDE